MPDAATLAVFCAAALALLVVPGPAVLYVVTQSVDHGRRAGLVSVLGVSTGGLVHVAAAALGLSSLLLSSATAFEVVKYAGAAYLIFLGVRRLLGKGEDADVVGVDRSPRDLFRRGVVVQILNPKTALFFFAFLPQFVATDGAPVALQLLLLGGLFLVLATISDGAYAVAAGTLAERLRGSRTFKSAQRWVSGTVLVGLGALAARSRA
jgi:threonine/homoserine/homoserine lactone efflux protein